MAVPSTSGNVGLMTFKTLKIVEHGFRRCKMAPEEVSPQNLQVALDCLFLNFSKMANRGIPLWTIERDILGMSQGQYKIDCPLGTEETLNLNLRTIQRVDGINTSTQGNADLAFDGDVATACTQTTPGGNITVTFEGDTNITILGILPNATGSWSIVVETSDDGINWTPIYTNTAFLAIRGVWQWIDLDNPTTTLGAAAQNGISVARLRAIAPTILDVDEFVLANTPQEIPMAVINRDDYANLPDHTFQGRPVQWWFDRLYPVSQMWIWPAANAAAVFQQLILYRHRQIQDVGQLFGLVEIPQRWYDAVIWDLAMLLCDSIKEVAAGRKEEIRSDADMSITRAWNGESDGSPIFIRPNISPYTK